MGVTRRRVADQEKEELLTGYMRGKIHGYIVAKKFAHYNQVKRDLGLNNGTAAYHLRVLEKRGVIKSLKKGQRRCYYAGALPDELKETEYSDMERGLATELMEHPGLCASELAEVAGITQAAITYHVKRLESGGIILRKGKGPYTELFLTKSADI